MPSHPQAYPVGLRRRLLLEWLCLAVVLSALMTALTVWDQAPIVRDLNQQAYDASMRLAPRPAASHDIVLIAIDDASIEALGYWPWRRAVHARLLSHLGGARAVVLDMILADEHPQYQEDDQLLARAIQRQGHVFLPDVLGPLGQHLIRPLPILSQAAAGIGRIDAQPDPDGRLRSIQLLRTDAQGRALPHISLSLARALGQQDHLLQSSLEWPPDTPSYLQFSASNPSYTRVPYLAVLNGDVPASTFQDKIVLIGAWASGLGDRLATARGGGLLPGVEILANTIQNQEQSLWIHTPSRTLTLPISLIILWSLCLALRQLSNRWGLVCMVLTMAISLMIDAVLMSLANLWIPPAPLLLTLGLAYLLGSWRTQEATLQHIDHELERLRIQADPQPRTQHHWFRPDTLPARAARLHQAISRLKTTAQNQEETLGFISHDMRSPQNAILAAVALRRQAPDQWHEPDVLGHIEQQAHATLRLVDDFVQLARAESAVLQKHPCLLDDLVQDCCDQHWTQASQRNIQLSFQPSSEEPDVLVDSELLRRAVGNLLDNAILYTPDQGTVRCRVHQKGAYWCIQVQDSGPGIRPEDLEHLFTRFWRAPGDGNKPTGSGLGLAFVHTVAVRHGGLAHCTSQPGQGACFSICLPA